MRPSQHQRNTPVADDILSQRGASSLSDFELYKILINDTTTKHSREAPAPLLKLMRDGIDKLTYNTLLELPGMSKERAQIISASAELIKRHHYREVKPLTTHEDILTRLIDLRTKPQETFICLSLDGGQRLIAQRVVTIGSLDAALIHPRDIFTHPIGDNAASIVVAHNHPSGDPTPSTLNAEEILRHTQAIVRMQSIQFSLKALYNTSGSIVYFQTPDSVEIPTGCMTVYATTQCHIASLTLPNSALIVNYSSTLPTYAPLLAKTLLEEAVTQRWKEIAHILQRLDINPRTLSLEDSTQQEVLDQALDMLIDSPDEFLTKAFAFQ